MKRFTTPQRTRFILPPIHPTKSSLRCVGGIFLFQGRLHLENFMSRLNVILCHNLTLSVSEPDNAAAKQGQELRSGQTVTPIHEQSPSTCFCTLTIRKHLLMKIFERSGRGQEPSRGHKLSILENLVLYRDFTSQTLANLRSDLVGACLPQTLLIIRALRHEWNGVSCFT